jgi:hypothetical protein
MLASVATEASFNATAPPSSAILGVPGRAGPDPASALNPPALSRNGWGDSAESEVQAERPTKVVTIRAIEVVRMGVAYHTLP